MRRFLLVILLAVPTLACGGTGGTVESGDSGEGAATTSTNPIILENPSTEGTTPLTDSFEGGKEELGITSSVKVVGDCSVSWQGEFQSFIPKALEEGYQVPVYRQRDDGIWGNLGSVPVTMDGYGNRVLRCP